MICESSAWVWFIVATLLNFCWFSLALVHIAQAPSILACPHVSKCWMESKKRDVMGLETGKREMSVVTSDIKTMSVRALGYIYIYNWTQYSIYICIPRTHVYNKCISSVRKCQLLLAPTTSLVKPLKRLWLLRHDGIVTKTKKNLQPRQVLERSTPGGQAS